MQTQSSDAALWADDTQQSKSFLVVSAKTATALATQRGNWKCSCVQWKDTLNTHYPSTCPQFDTKLRLFLPFLDRTLFSLTLCVFWLVWSFFGSMRIKHTMCHFASHCVLMSFLGGAHPLQIYIFTHFDKNSSGATPNSRMCTTHPCTAVNYAEWTSVSDYMQTVKVLICAIL